MLDSLLHRLLTRGLHRLLHLSNGRYMTVSISDVVLFFGQHFRRGLSYKRIIGVETIVAHAVQLVFIEVSWLVVERRARVLSISIEQWKLKLYIGWINWVEIRWISDFSAELGITLRVRSY